MRRHLSRPRPLSARTKRPRIETLENRDLPGSYFALAGGAIEPMHDLAGALGDAAMMSRIAASPAASAKLPIAAAVIPPTPPPFFGKPDGRPGEANPGTQPDKREERGSQLPLDLELPVISIGDLAQFPARTGEAGGAAGGDGKSPWGGLPVISEPVSASPPGGPDADQSFAPPAVDAGSASSGSVSSGAVKKIAAAMAIPAAESASMTHSTEPPSPSAPGPVAAATTAAPIFAVGPDEGHAPRVTVYDAVTRQLKYSYLAFGESYNGGVRVAMADVTGDGVADIIAGKGDGSRVRVTNGKTGNQINGPAGDFNAFAPGFSDGVFVAAGDVTGDGRADIIVGSDGDGPPSVNVINGRTGRLIRALDLSDLGLTGGVRVAAGDVNGDSRADVIVAGGPGSLSLITVFDGGNFERIQSYFGFNLSDRGGVNLSAGDINADGYVDVIAGQGAGGMLKAFSGRDTASMRNLQAFPDTAECGSGSWTPTATAGSAFWPPRGRAGSACGCSKPSRTTRPTRCGRTARRSTPACSSPVTPGRGLARVAGAAASACCRPRSTTSRRRLSPCARGRRQRSP